MSYAWIIDVDHIPSEHAKPGTLLNSRGLLGPNDADPSLMEELTTNRQAGLPFRLFDDDGMLYYEGRLLASGGQTVNDADYYSSWLFAPLDDFGRGNAGCTEIQYAATGKMIMVPGSDDWEAL